MSERIRKTELRHRYSAGNQESFSEADRRIARYGCGLIGLADLILYLRERTWKEGGAGETGIHSGPVYDAFVRRMDHRLARARRKVGLNGFSMAAAFNSRARKRGWKLRARWGVPRERLLSSIREMLARDIPVILSVGPGFGRREHMKGTTLYRGNTPAERAFEHYVTVIGMEETGEKTWFRVMSWGREFRIDAEEYLRGVEGSIPLLGRFFSNILYVREI